ncbi:MAG: hypothetical protein R3F58_09375 [Steroidobacteraceae bacterium]
MSTLNQNVKIVSALDYASGSANRNGAVIDTAAFEGALLQVHFAAIAGAVSIAAAHGNLADGSDMSTIASTSRAIAPADSNKIISLDLFRPLKRYVRLVVTKGGNTSAESAQVILYGPKHAPVVDPNVTEHRSPVI